MANPESRVENEFGGKWLADTNPNHFWNQAKSLATAGDYIEAEKLYGQALAFNPYDVRRLAIAEELAELYISWGRLTDASECLDAIIQVRPSKGALEKKARIATVGRFIPEGPSQK
jgi:tetratricopeptide (TPR) repeat protein